MASVCRSPRTTDERCGGKTVRGRHIADARSKTPYDRPASAVRSPPRNPNWLTGLIFPTSRMIATGATKLLSSVFGPDTSSSSSSSGTDSSSEDGMDDENDDHDVPSDDDFRLNKNGTTSELIECFRMDPQLAVGKSETKPVIEKLLMQETYSRKESDRLMKIINSRVIDGCDMEEGQDGKLGDIPSTTVDIPELCNQAVMEAKQWIEEKKAASSLKSDLDHGTCTPSSFALSQVTEGEFVSPVDIAKGYMRAHPPWTSPLNHVETGIPSPIGRELLKDETSYSVATNSFTSSKKIYSLSCGSWNIQEEIRRLRSKATEDMLRTTSSTQIDLSSFARERKSIHKPFLADIKYWERGDKMHNLTLFPDTKSIHASRDFPARASTCRGLPASALELKGNSLWDDDMPSQPIIFALPRNQDLGGIQTVEGEGHAGSNSCHQTIPDLALEDDSIMSDRTYSSDKEESGLKGNPSTNSFPISGSSCDAGDNGQNRRSLDDKSPKPVSSSLDKLVNSAPLEETCELLSEASMEVPDINETSNGAAAASFQNSCSMHCEELSKELLAQPNPDDNLTGKTTTVVDKPQGRKLTSRYNRKSRGKG